MLVGDILQELDGQPVTGPDDLREVIGDRPGQTVKLVISRGGQRVELTADPETLPSGLPVRREESTTIYDPNLPNAPPPAEPPAAPQSRKKPRR